ncbi:MAG: hypothetical protein L0H94_02900 [Nitrospira sp.]|nr:hypothetical protein [Nitrospira sp.]
MNQKSKLAFALAGIAGLALSAESAQAALDLNGTGSSAGQQFAGLAPAGICAATPTPLLFVSSDGKKYEWQCTINGQANSRVRYSGTASEEGYTKQPNGAVGTAIYLNVSGQPGCPAGSPTPILGKNVLRSVCPANQATQTLPVHWGGSDVQGPSLHQNRGGGDAVTPPPTGHLTTTGTVIVPFSIVVGHGVKNGTGGDLTTLTEMEIRQIVAGAETNWEDLGYQGGAIFRCQRTAGSGTLAAYDEIFTQSPYYAATTYPGFSNTSSSNLVACINANAASIGYMDSDAAVPAKLTAGGHAVAIGGQSGQNDVQCGRYPYWATWNFITRTAGVEAAPIGAAAGTNAAIDDLQASMAENNPIPTFWVRLKDSFVTKNQDRGPHRWPSQVNGNGQNIATVCN